MYYFSKVIVSTIFLLILSISPVTYSFTVLINPAGSAQYAGRHIGDHFERGLTLQCAQALQAQLSTSHITTIINTLPDTRSTTLHTAQIANRAQPDLVITLHFYQETAPKPSLYLYNFSYGDHFMQPSTHLQLLPYDQAHRINYRTTQQLSTQLQQHLSYYSSLFNIVPTTALPCKELCGIVAPAIIIEMGLKQKDDWRMLVEPLCHSLLSFVNKR